MANTNDFLIQLLAKLDVSSVNKEFEELKKRLTNDPVIQKVTLDTSMSKQAIKSMASEIHNELGKAFKATGIESFDITVKDVESILSSAVKESNKLAKELESASSKAQKFLAQFNNKSGGILVNSKEFKAVQDAINGLGKTSSIDDLNKAMNTLETTYNNMVSSLRNSGKSLNPFINAKNEMATMNDTIKGIGLEFEKLTSKPKAVSDAIKQLSAQQSKVNSYTIGTQEWADAYGKLQQMIQKVNSEISNLRKAQSAKVSTQIFNTSDLKNNNIAYMSKVYNTIEKQMVEINRLAKAKDWQIVDVSGVEQADGKIKKLTLTVRDAEGALKKLDMQREKLQGNGKAQYGLMQVGDVKVLETASQAMDQLAKRVNKIQLSMGVNGDTTSKIEVLRNNFTKLGLSADEVKTKMNGVDTEVKTLQSLMNSGADNSAIVTQFEKLQTVLTQTQNNLKQTRSDYSLLATEQQRLSLANTIEAWNQKNTRATRAVREENDRYIASLRDLNTEMSKTQFGKIQTSFKQAENSMRAMNRLGASLKNQWIQATQSFTMWLSASRLVMKVMTEISQSINTLKDVNTQLTEISKTNWDLTQSDLQNIAMNGFDVASEYGKSISNYLSGVKDMSRAGYDNAEAMAELSVSAQGAGDMTDEVANKMIIATDKAYKLGGSVEELTKVLDGVNWICDNNAVNMTELSEAMSVVGSTAASTGVDVNELTAVLGTMAATTQQSGSEVARAFKAILLNIKQVSDEEEGIDAEGLTKYEKACNALGVSLKETRNGVLQTRDAMEVLKDLSVEYNKLNENDIKRVNLLNSVGGKLRSTQLDALLRQWDTYESMLEQYASGQGTMAKEAEKTANSWEGSMNRLSNTWTKVIGNVANSDAIIGAVNGLNSILSVIDKITGSLGSLGTIGLGAGLLASFKGAGRVKIAYPHLYIYIYMPVVTKPYMHKHIFICYPA